MQKKQLDTCLSNTIPVIIIFDSSSTKQKKIPLTHADQKKQERQNEKWKLIQEIQEAHREGKNLSRLAREYHLSRSTIQKYIKMQEPPSFESRRKKSIDSYYHNIVKLEQNGNTVKEIYQIIQKQSFDGSFSAVRRMVE